MTQRESIASDGALPVVLVIDDELGPRESLRFLLKDEYQVLCADSVEEGLKILQKQAPDIVIMDIRMPGMNGIDGLREIRKIDAELSVIMLTGFAALDTAQEAIRNEASDYVEKPFDATAMRDIVRRYVAQTQLRRKRNMLLSETDALDSRIRELQKKSKLVELGQSSSEFVHDLRNALTAVTGSSSLLRMEIEDLKQRNEVVPADAGHYLDSLEKAMQRCVEMLNTWQRMIMDKPPQFTQLHVNALVKGCVEACLSAAEKIGAHLVCDTNSEDVVISGDQVQLSRIIANLIHNAMNALPAKNGHICVATRSSVDIVKISVIDNGCGIAEENLSKVFDLNYSTRRACGGMGLGLFITQKIAQAHNGRVTVESVVNQGSTFTLVLPRVCDAQG